MKNTVIGNLYNAVSFKMVRLLSASAILALGTTNCAMDAQSGEEPASTSQAVTTSDAGFVWSGATTGSFDANSSYSYNSSGGTNHITQLATGQYRVDFPSLGSNVFGDVQVTAYGSGSERCKVSSWGASGTTLQVFVNCFSATGAASNTLFTANYVRRSGAPGQEGGYVWANQASSASYTASTSYQWNSTGGAITITHTPGTGAYSVSLAGQNMGGGTVEVTAYGANNTYCNVAGWGGSVINVACFNGSTGAAAESQFDLIFANLGSPNNVFTYSYAWANQPSAASYNPDSTYERGFVVCDKCPSVQPNATITRSSVGHYSVRFPNVAASSAASNVKVTGYSSGSDTCKVTGWFTSGWDGVANVACFSAAVAAVDAFYTITYSSLVFIIG